MKPYSKSTLLAASALLFIFPIAFSQADTKTVETQFGKEFQVLPGNIKIRPETDAIKDDINALELKKQELLQRYGPDGHNRPEINIINEQLGDLRQKLNMAGERKADNIPSQGLPLRQVSLFSSGVGYFGRAGRVSGDGAVELYFQRDELNDVLKSLVITDPSGELRPATYTLDELLARRPQNNDLQLPAGETLGGILRRFQGALIEIEANGRTIRGRLVGVATKNIKDKNGEVTTTDVATIMQESGLASVRLDAVEDGGVVRLLDEKLNQKLLAQLENSAALLTSSIDAGFRPITLHFAGKGEREVKAGYIQATSVWKTSYRLVFDSPKNGKKKDADKSSDIQPLLQGWAIVENTTDEDWKDISLSLIAGRPVSFTMNMAAPLYVQRPDVALPFAGAPRSQIYEEASEAKRALKPRNMPAPVGATGATGPPGLATRSQGIFSNSGDFDSSARDEIAISAEELLKQESSATTAERGELFEYAIRQPVTLNRGEAALVPIVSQTISGDKLSILDTRDPAFRAVYGMRITNNTGMHLAGGPITIYQDGLYAGDAQITNIAPGENRLISYALDLDLVVGREAPTHFEETLGLTAKSGVLTITRRQRQAQVYTFRNKSDQAKTVLVQVPIDPDFKLVEPAQADEKSPNEYRFEVVVPAKGSANLKVVGERPISETVAILNSDIDTLVGYTRFGKISPQLKTALEGVVARRNKLRDLQGRRASLENQIREISVEQDRIRQNMNGLGRDSELYKRYVTKLETQETQIEKLREEIARLRELENDANKELSTYVQSLSFE